MAKREILAISFYFPPLAAARSIQVARLLSGADAKSTVICGADPREQIDVSVGISLDSDKVRATAVKNRLSFMHLLWNAANSRSGMNLHTLPDPFKAWNQDVLQICYRSMLKEKCRPEVIITFGTPMSSHLAGLKFKKATTVPWIAHFSDPWTDNPYRNDNAITRAVNLKQERAVIENCDAAIFTSPETIELVMRKYPAELKRKIHYLPHCFDSDAYGPPKNPPKDRYIIRSMGSFYGKRSPEPLFAAVEKIAAETPMLFDSVEIEFYGNLYGHAKLLSRYPAAKKRISLAGSVDYKKCLRLELTAHCLLSIDAKADNSVFFPSKLVDYIGAGRHIFSITPPGCAARITKSSGGTVADPSKPDDVAATLSDVLTRRPLNESGPDIRYDQHSVCTEFDGILDSVLGEK